MPVENFGDKRGTGDFSKNPQNINRKGRPSLDKELFKLLEEDPKLTTSVIEKLLSLTHHKNPSVALKAINTILDRVDGKAIQKILQENTHEIKDPQTWGEAFRKKT